MIVSSFRTGHPVAPGPFTFKNYLVAYFNPLTYRMIFNTVLFAGAGTAITVSIAVLFAWLIERTDMPLRNLCWSLLLVPMAMPGLLFSIAYVFLLSPRSGIVNVFLRALFGEIGIEVSEGPINIYSLGGMIFLDGIRGVTTVFLLVVGAFRMMDPALEEASWAAGARNWTTLRRVTLPVLWPALLAAIIYEFSSSMESFEAPLVVGLPGGVYVYSTMIYISTREPLPNYGLGRDLRRELHFNGGRIRLLLPTRHPASERALHHGDRQRISATNHGAGPLALSGVGAVLWLFFYRRCTPARCAHLDFAVAGLSAAFHGSGRSSKLE